MNKYTWFDIPGLTGYQIREDWQSVRSVTRRVYSIHCYDPRVVRGRKLKLTYRINGETYRIYGTHYSVARLMQAVKHPKTRAIKRPPKAPYHVEIV